METAVTAEGLSKRYRIGELHSAYGTLRESLTKGTRRALRLDHRAHYEEIWALRDVSFDLEVGGVLGVIGRNGAGKSTLLRILTRITTPTEGRATIRGRVGSLLEVGTGFHPELTGRENIYLNGSILGMKQREIGRKFPDIVDFSGVEKFIDTPVKRYSSGMSVRLAFAVAAHLEPEVLLIDEVLAVGDVEFQRRCLGRMESLSQSGRTVVFVSHNMQAITTLCERAILLDAGRVVRDGSSAEVVAYYLQSEHGTGAVRSWPEGREPGNKFAQLVGVRVLQDGEVAPTVDVRRPVGIELAFRVLRQEVPLFPKIKLLDQHGEVAFNAIDTSPQWDDPLEPGEYVSTAWIPGNLLNEGLTTVDVAVCSFGPAKFIHHAGETDAVSFHVHDPAEGDSARGAFVGQWKGVVRPLLEWTTEER